MEADGARAEKVKRWDSEKLNVRLPMKLVTAEQMRVLERRADKSGNTYAMMMERAG